MNKEVILQILAGQKQSLFEFGVDQIRLFGSFLRNDANADSDIDLPVEIRKEKKLSKNL